MPLEDYIAQLTFNGFFSYKIKRNKADHRTLNGLRIVTMHRLKDFEFQHVFIVAVNKRIEADVRIVLSMATGQTFTRISSIPKRPEHLFRPRKLLYPILDPQFYQDDLL